MNPHLQATGTRVRRPLWTDRSRTIRLLAALAGIVLVVLAASTLGSYPVELITQVLIYALFAMSLDLLVG